MKWAIFYDNGEIFTSNDGEAWDAPAVGVLVLMQVDSEGKRVLYSKDDYYCWGWRSPNDWVACNEDGKNDYLYHHRGPKAILFGRWTTNLNFHKIEEKAKLASDDIFMPVWRKANEVWRGLNDGI